MAGLLSIRLLACSLAEKEVLQGRLVLEIVDVLVKLDILLDCCGRQFDAGVNDDDANVSDSVILLQLLLSSSPEGTRESIQSMMGVICEKESLLL